MFISPGSLLVTRHRAQRWLLAAALCSLPLAATAATPSHEQQYQNDKKTIEARYTSDKQLCNEEKTAQARMQCKRDAQDLYQSALTNAKQKRDDAKRAAQQQSTKQATLAKCADCAEVIAVRSSKRDGQGSPVGMIAGGVAGAVLGHQVGGGSGKDLATIAGAVGGAYAGHKIEEKMRATEYWEVSIRHANGDQRSFTYEQKPNLNVGDTVKVNGNDLVKY